MVRERAPLTRSEDDRRALIVWAVACAERALPLFEEACSGDHRPREALMGAMAFARGELRIGAVRQLAAACSPIRVTRTCWAPRGLGNVASCPTDSPSSFTHEPFGLTGAHPPRRPRHVRVAHRVSTCLPCRCICICNRWCAPHDAVVCPGSERRGGVAHTPRWCDTIAKETGRWITRRNWISTCPRCQSTTSRSPITSSPSSH
jgi:hypothetical protein